MVVDFIASAYHIQNIGLSKNSVTNINDDYVSIVHNIDDDMYTNSLSGPLGQW